jgi:hypothetical protein
LIIVPHLLYSKKYGYHEFTCALAPDEHNQKAWVVKKHGISRKRLLCVKSFALGQYGNTIKPEYRRRVPVFPYGQQVQAAGDLTGRLRGVKNKQPTKKER